MNEKCPICNSSDIRVSYTFSLSEVSNQIAKDFNILERKKLKIIISRLLKSDNIRFFLCRNCSYGFSFPYVAGNTEFYSTLYASNFDYPKIKWEYKKTLANLCNELYYKLKEEKKIIEIGAGNGSFLQLISPKVFKNKNVYSTEFSKDAVESIINKGFNCYNYTVIELAKNVNDVKFDFICMFQVLEHLDNVNEIFDSLNKFSKEGTILFVAVPNSRLRNFLDMKKIHLDIPPIHVGKFELDTFAYLAKRYKWKIKEYEYEPMSYINKIKKIIFRLYWQNETCKDLEKNEFKVIRLFNRYRMLLYLLIKHMFVIIKLRKKDMGTSFWIKLERIES